MLEDAAEVSGDGVDCVFHGGRRFDIEATVEDMMSTIRLRPERRETSRRTNLRHVR